MRSTSALMIRRRKGPPHATEHARFSQDRTVIDHRLRPARSAASPASPSPTAGRIGLFLGLIVVDASPAPPPRSSTGRSSTRASPSSAPASSSASPRSSPPSPCCPAAIGLAQRWFSARIGEGLIHDLRTQVFDHVQRMPIGFFSRAQTGALVSRLNSDVQGAQQAFTSTLSNVVGNVVAVVTTLAAMFVLSWQITLLVAGPAAAVRPAGPLGRPPPGRHHPREVPPQRRDGPDDDRALQRLGRPARQAVRPSGDRVRRRSRPGPGGSATSASPRPCTPASS